jgi:CheY-like chemotaxis protein
VWDTGPGIAEKDRGRIFEEFVQLENPERDRRKGLGLGLSIVRRLCNLLGHPLTLESRLGRGSVFRFQVPAGQEPASIPQRNANAPADPSLLAGKTVVVVDDDIEIQTGMRALLTGWGMNVSVYTSANEAETAVLAMTDSPDLVIADYRLPGGATGLDAIESIRRRFRTAIPAILITGSADPQLVSSAAERNFHYLLKPVMPAKLRTLVTFKIRGGST